MTPTLLNRYAINTYTLHTTSGHEIPTASLGIVRGVQKGGLLLQVQFGPHIITTTPDRIIPVIIPADVTLEDAANDLIAIVERFASQVDELREALAAERAKVARLQTALKAAVKLAGPRTDFRWRELPGNDDDRPQNGNGHRKA